MKRLIGLCLALAILCSYPCSATDNEKSIKYLKSEEGYDYGSDIVYIARDSETGEIIPLAIGPLDGYSYAYIGDGKAFDVEKLTYKTPFNDLSKKFGYVSYVHEMSARNVVVGYDDGSFKPENVLTRAEMAAIFARLFSVEKSDAASCFEDVPADHWAREYIMALVDNGVLVKSASFDPDTPISREQLVVMTYRMLVSMGFSPSEEEMDYSKYKDLDKVSDYARVAYTALINENYHLMVELVDNDFMDTADDEFYFHPQNTVTRLECCEYLYDFIRTFTSNNAPAIRRADAPQIEIPVLDGSTSTYDITKNIYHAFYHNSDKAPGFPKAHSKTTNSYRRLIDGEVEMIFVPDAGEDVLKYAEEKGVKLKFIPIANEALVFFTGTKNTVDNITTQQLRDIYVNNGITNWMDLGGSDSTLAAYCRNTDSGSHAQMENFILDGNEINESISKERTSVMMSSILTEVDDYNRKNKGSFAMGYSLYYYYFNNQMFLGPVDLKLMSIDGIAPTEETIANGTYPYTTNYYAVIRDGENNPRVDAFAELMQGEFGDAIVQLSGLGAIK